MDALYSHQSRVWHPFEWTGHLDQVALILASENLLAVDQIVKMMIQASVITYM